MKVILEQPQIIESFAAYNSGSRIPLKLWHTIVKHANWEHAVDILQAFSNAELLANGSDRVVFNIGGRYKLICHYKFGKAKIQLLVCWIGSLAQYKRLCDERKQFTESYDISNFDEPVSTDVLIDAYPVRIVEFLMKENNLKPAMLATAVGVSTSTVSGILSYRSNISQEVAIKLGVRFKMSHEAFIKKQ